MKEIDLDWKNLQDIYYIEESVERKKQIKINKKVRKVLNDRFFVFRFLDLSSKDRYFYLSKKFQIRY